VPFYGIAIKLDPQAFPPAKMICSAPFSPLYVFVAISIRLFTVSNPSQGHQNKRRCPRHTFSCIEIFLSRPKIYTEVPATPLMAELVFDLGILAHKQIKQG